MLEDFGPLVDGSREEVKLNQQVIDAEEEAKFIEEPAGIPIA